MAREGAARAPTPEERPGLLDWLDDGLRGGRRGRLAAEYPLSLGPDGAALHRALWRGGEPVSHAMVQVASLAGEARGLALGMIGLVYTRPEERGRGLARRCIQACLSELRGAGVPLVALWSDRHDFYRRLGFEPGGRELHYRIDSAVCRRAGPDAARQHGVRAVQPGDWGSLESLYASKPVGARRRPGDLARLAGAPETRVLVAHRDGRPRAYAALGRGDDFRGVVHEWAGEADAVLACLEQLCREHTELGLLLGPLDEEPAPRLRAAGAATLPGCFALLRLLDPAAAWRAATSGADLSEPLALDGPGPRLRAERGTLSLGPSEALALLYGPEMPAVVRAWLSPAERRALAARLPAPLYLWGFDSI